MTEQTFILRDEKIICRCVQFMRSCFDQDVMYEVILRPFKSKRSIQQNRLYWVWVKILADEVGVKKEPMHEYLKARFLDESLARVFGTVVATTKSTTDLNTKRFTEYLGEIESFATDQGYTLPHPEHIYEIAMKHGTRRACSPHSCPIPAIPAPTRDKAEFLTKDTA